MTRRRATFRLSSFLWQAVAIFLSVLFLLPLAFMIVGSLRMPGLAPPRGIEWLPDPISWSNYAAVFQRIELGRYALNTLVVELIAVPVTLIVSSLTGFALAQMRSRISQTIIAISFFFLLLPETSLWVSRFILYKYAGILDTPFSLAAPSIFGTNPLYMLIFYWTYRRVSQEVWESARVDGAGAFRTWWSLGVPASRAAFAAVGVLTFVYYWREYKEPLLYIQTLDNYTLSVGLAYLEQLDRTNLPLLLAGSVVITVPLVIIFLLAQPFFLEPVEYRRMPEQGANSPDSTSPTSARGELEKMTPDPEQPEHMRGQESPSLRTS